MAYASAFYAGIDLPLETKSHEGGIRITAGEIAINLSIAEAIALRDQLADALTQASIHNDAKAASEVSA